MKLRVCAALSICLFAGSAFAINAGQLDDFESGTAMQWSNGPSSPNQPFAVQEGDNWFVRNISNGGSGPGSRMVLFNRAQWTGNYVSAGVSALTMDLRNSGDTDLHIRLGLLAQTGTRTATNQAYELSAGSDWTTVTFDITDLTILFGSETVTDILSGVIEMRILSSVSVDYQADAIAGTLDVDNVRTGVPAPGAGALFLLGAAGATRRRR